MSTLAPLDASRAMYEAVGRGDWNAVAAMMADDFVIHEPASLPYGGEWRGPDALQRLYAHVMGFWDDPVVEWDELVGGERHTVALLRFTVTARATGERFQTRIAEVTTFAPDGRMAAMHIHYFDTADLARRLDG